jgi:hypothetical protein
MTLKQLGANKTELTFSDGTMVLFSYQTPVAAYVTDEDGESRWYHTDCRWSRTTSRHISTWVNRYAGTKPQSFFDELVRRVRS